MQRVNQVSVDMLQIVRCYVMLGSHIHGHGVKHFCSGRHKVFRRGSIFSSQGELTPFPVLMYGVRCNVSKLCS